MTMPYTPEKTRGTWMSGEGYGMATESKNKDGAWAVLKQVSSSASVSSVLARLSETGRPVTDSANGVTKPRIRVLSASVRYKDTGFVSGGAFKYLGGSVASNGVGLATRAGGPSSGTITISGIPSTGVVRKAFLYWMTIGGPAPVAYFKGTILTGALVGASRDTCWNVQQYGPNRVYRADVTSLVAGNGSYPVSGVGGGLVDGQGASLVVVYSSASFAVGRIYLRHGALTVNTDGATMSHTFKGLSVPSTPTQVRLHVGIADGGGFYEQGMQLQGIAVTNPNFFSGKDGKMWDDDRITVSPALLPSGTTSRTNSLTSGAPGDCLAWAYSALAYQYPPLA